MKKRNEKKKDYNILDDLNYITVFIIKLMTQFNIFRKLNSNINLS